MNSNKIQRAQSCHGYLLNYTLSTRAAPATTHCLHRKYGRHLQQAITKLFTAPPLILFTIHLASSMLGRISSFAHVIPVLQLIHTVCRADQLQIEIRN